MSLYYQHMEEYMGRALFPVSVFFFHYLLPLNIFLELSSVLIKMVADIVAKEL